MSNLELAFIVNVPENVTSASTTSFPPFPLKFNGAEIIPSPILFNTELDVFRYKFPIELNMPLPNRVNVLSPNSKLL